MQCSKTLCYDCSGCFRLERLPGGACTPLESAAFSRRTPIGDIDKRIRRKCDALVDYAAKRVWEGNVKLPRRRPQAVPRTLSQGVGIATLIFRYFLRYFSSTHPTDLSARTGQACAGRGGALSAPGLLARVMARQRGPSRFRLTGRRGDQPLGRLLSSQEFRMHGVEVFRLLQDFLVAEQPFLLAKLNPQLLKGSKYSTASCVLGPLYGLGTFSRHRPDIYRHSTLSLHRWVLQESAMCKTFRPWKIDEPLFLPPTVQDFVAEDDLRRQIVKLNGRCGALLPLFRLVGVRCIAALRRVEKPTASPQGSPELNSLALGRPQMPVQVSAPVRRGESLTGAKCWAVRFLRGRAAQHL